MPVLQNRLQITQMLLDVIGQDENLCIGLFDAAGRVTLANVAFLDLWPLPRERILGNTLDQIDPKGLETARFCAQIQYVLTSGDTLSDRLVMAVAGNRADEFDYTLHFVQAGETTGVIGIGRLRQVDAAAVGRDWRTPAVRPSSAGHVVDNLPEMVWRSLDGGRWIWCNARWTEVTGLSVNASSGFGWLEAVHPGDREAVMGRWRVARAPGSLTMDLRILRRQDHGYRWVQLRASPSQAGTERVTQWVGIFFDIDDLHGLFAGQQRYLADLQGQLRDFTRGVRSVAAMALADDNAERIDERRFNEKMDVLERLKRLASLHDSGPVTVERVIRAELTVLLEEPDARVVLAGPPVSVPPPVRQPLALFVNELLVGSLERGPLSTRAGTLRIEWTAYPAAAVPRRLAFAWSERNAGRVPDGKSVDQSASSEHAVSLRDKLARRLPREPGCRLLRYDLVETGVDCAFEFEWDGHPTAEPAN